MGEPTAVATRVETLVAEHRDHIVRLCARRLGGDRHLAEDVAQETFVKLGRALSEGVEIVNVGAWLRTVACNASVDELRRRRHIELVDHPPDAGVTDGEPGGSPELDDAWANLTTRHRQVLHLREVEGLRYEEIATAMATGVSAVETLLFRARAALRREYSRAVASAASAPAQLVAAPALVANRVLRTVVPWHARVLGAAPRVDELARDLLTRVAEIAAVVGVGGGAAVGLVPTDAIVPIRPPAVPTITAPALPSAPETPELTAPPPPTVTAPPTPETPAPPTGPVRSLVGDVVDVVRDLGATEGAQRPGLLRDPLLPPR